MYINNNYAYLRFSGRRALSPGPTAKVTRVLEKGSNASIPLDSMTDTQITDIATFVNKGRPTTKIPQRYTEEDIRTYIQELDTAQKSTPPGEPIPRSVSPASQLNGTGIYPIHFFRQEHRKPFPFDRTGQLAISNRQADKYTAKTGRRVEPLNLLDDLVRSYEEHHDIHKAADAALKAYTSQPQEKLKYRYWLAIDSTKNGLKASEVATAIQAANKLPLEKQAKRLAEIYAYQIRPFVKDHPDTHAVPADVTRKKIKSQIAKDAKIAEGVKTEAARLLQPNSPLRHLLERSLPGNGDILMSVATNPDELMGSFDEIQRRGVSQFVLPK